MRQRSSVLVQSVLGTSASIRGPGDDNNQTNSKGKGTFECTVLTYARRQLNLAIATIACQTGVGIPSFSLNNSSEILPLITTGGYRTAEFSNKRPTPLPYCETLA